MGFRPFGPDHWGVLIFTLAAAVALVANASRIREFREDRPLRYLLALVLLFNEVTSWFYFRSRGITLLPFHLCDWALFLMAAALLTRNRFAVETAYFWGLAASSQAIFTPDVHHAFPSYPWISFFLSHCGVVLSAVYLTARGEVKVTLGSVVRVWLLTNLYAVVAGLVNLGLGTNFGYLAGKPAQPSVLDYLGPWPYYIFWCELIALVLFFLAYGFSRIVERVAALRPGADDGRLREGAGSQSPPRRIPWRSR